MGCAEVNIKPIYRRVLLQQCVNAIDGMVGNIAVTDQYAARTTWFRILSVADDCEILSKERLEDFWEGEDSYLAVRGPELSRDHTCVDWENNLWITGERMIPAIVYVVEGREIVKLKCYRDKVMVEPDELPEEVHGIIMPETAKRKAETATIVDIGDSVRVQAQVKAGDKVLIPKYTGSPVTVNGKKCIIFDIDDILAIQT